MSRFFFLTACSIYLSTAFNFSFAQNIVPVKIVDGEAMPVITLPVTDIYANHPTEREMRRYQKLVRDVKKAYPYAKIAGGIFEKYSDVLANAQTEQEQDTIMKKVEDELKKKYEGIVKDLTVSQGKILIKLIDRETERTSYEIIKAFRGRFSAFLWQSLALLFRSDLTLEYDAAGDDKRIEEIIDGIESGSIYL